MKSLRFLMLLLAVAMVPLFAARAYAQQEVDPDHFDQPAAKAVASKSHHPKMVAARHHAHANAKVASNHGGKAHGHPQRAAS